MKTYIALVRDHSASMRGLAGPAANDYNLTIDGIRQSIEGDGQEAIISVVECGVGPTGAVKVKENLVPVAAVPPLSMYHTTGSATPLWDSVGAAISCIEGVADRNAPNVAFLVMVITDGHENSSRQWNAAKIADKIATLQTTDKWTFAFRVPRGHARQMVSAGIPAGNVMEWEQTEAALVASSAATVSATRSYFSSRASGSTSVKSFYETVDLNKISTLDIKQSLIDISPSVRKAHMGDAVMEIKDFCESAFGTYTVGRGYYQLSKSETIQENKKLVLFDKEQNRYYSGAQARQLLGLAPYGVVKVKPGSYAKYDLFVQSTSSNRKLMPKTAVLFI